MFKQDQMKRFYQLLCAFLIISLTMTSCLKGDETESVTPSNETAITGFVLGNINCYTESTSSTTGNDTIIKTVLTGSNYPMTIDQNSNCIYNATELPVGTDLQHVLISSISTRNNGIATIKPLDRDDYTLITTSDSIDFSQPRVFRVFSNTFDYFRDYTITLTVSKTQNATESWVKIATDDLLKDWTNKSLIAWNDTVQLVDKGIVVKGNTAFRMKDTTVQQSTDLINWSDITTAPLSQLLGTNSYEIYALGTDGQLKRSLDNGVTWIDEAIDAEASLLPKSQITTTTWAYAPLNDAYCTLMAGLNQNGEMCFWRKISQKDNAGQWVYMPIESNNRFTMPAQNHLSMAYVNGNIYAVGDNLIVYVSRDQGITWKEVSTYALPSSAQGSEYAMTVDSLGSLWLITNAGQIWKW